jgi:tRNA-binding protein
MAEISFDDFTKVDIRLGRIVDAAPYPEARKPAIKLWIDFGAELGVKKSSAQITQHYAPDQLFGKQILAVVNFPPRQIGRFMSEVLVLGVSGDDGGIVLVGPRSRGAAWFAVALKISIYWSVPLAVLMGRLVLGQIVGWAIEASL